MRLPAARLLSKNASRRAALPLALVLSVGAVGCRSTSGPMEALSGVRVSATEAMVRTKEAVLNPLSPAQPGGSGAVATAPDPFRAAEQALAQGGGAAAGDRTSETPTSDGPRFAGDFDATIAVLRDEAAPFPSPRPTIRDNVALAGAEEDGSGVTAAAGEDPFAAAMEELADAPAPPADLA
ncbi:hypothetical protein, partial [Alienimonas chondri]|uniref:hypothetical protein n=1 Tax=Alienimonas chondri TaxID=2681879 RepID=UPI001489AF5E